MYSIIQDSSQGRYRQDVHPEKPPWPRHDGYKPNDLNHKECRAMDENDAITFQQAPTINMQIAYGVCVFYKNSVKLLYTTLMLYKALSLSSLMIKLTCCWNTIQW